MSVALTVTDLGVQAASPPSLPKTASLSEKFAHAEQSAAEWAARYTGEAARVDVLAKRNAALLDQIANLTSLLTACTGSQSPPPAEASTAAALVAGPPSTAAPPEASTAVYPSRRSGLKRCCAVVIQGCTAHLVIAQHGKVLQNSVPRLVT